MTDSILKRLEQIVHSHLPELFQGIGTTSATFTSLCADITSVVNSFLEEPDIFDLSSEQCVLFLKKSLPILCEVIFKRKNKMEHEEIIANMFCTVVKLLAQPGSHEIAELCELRNYLLLGFPSQFKFIDQKQLRVSGTLSSYTPSFATSGFFGEYGRPNIFVKGSKYYYFWPDEWERDLGGFKSIGHFIKVYVDDIWIQGQVVDYVADLDQYTISYSKDLPSVVDGESTSPPLPETATITVHLLSTTHYWADMLNKDKLGASPTRTTKSSHAQQQLEFSQTDIGTYLRIWWSKYKQYFYGKIIAYNPDYKKHTVLYEDGDVREYEFLSSSKEFEILLPAPEILNAMNELATDELRIAAFSKWHKSTLVIASNANAGTSSIADDGNAQINISGAGNAGANDNIKSDVTTGSFKTSTVVPRPNPAEAYHTSLHQHRFVHEYFSENGADSIFLTMTDSTQPSPSCFIVWLHLMLLYGLKNIIAAAIFKTLVWDVKEAISGCLLRYDDTQIKNLNAVTLSDTLNILQELVNLAMISSSTKEPISVNSHGSSNSKASRVHESIDYLKLNISQMLLNCSQLQKRYMGLSMIKEGIETCSPKIPNFVTKRSNYLLGIKSSIRGNYGVNDKPYAQNTQGKISLSSGSMERWLVQNNFIDQIFGNSLHQDLAAKSDTILVFLAHRRVFTERHVELLWNSAKGAHEAVVRVLHHLILLLIPVLEPSIRMYLFNIIAATPNKEMNEHTLLLIKNFTLQALLSMKEELPQVVAADDLPEGNGQGTLFFPDTTTDKSLGTITTSIPLGHQSSTTTSDSSTIRDGRKGLVMNAPQRHWLGFSVLWQFVQDTSEKDSVEEHLIDIAIQYIVDLLDDSNCFKDERELVMHKCLENVQIGSSVPVSLRILRMTIATYPTPSKSWFQVGRSAVAKQLTAASQIEKLQKQNRLLDVFFTEFSKYQNSLAEQQNAETDGMQSTPAIGFGPAGSSTMIPINDRKLFINGKFSRITHLKGIAERLEFLKFVLSRSAVILSEAHVFLLWNTLGKSAVSVETLDIVVCWFESLLAGESKYFSSLIASVAQETDPSDPTLPSKLAFLGASASSNMFNDTGNNSNVPGFRDREYLSSTAPEGQSSFEENVLVNLFENMIVSWASSGENVHLVSRPPVASFCIKLFLLVNISNRSIKVEADGTWSRVGQLSGLSLLYRLAVDSVNKSVSDAAIGLLVELHHRIPTKLRGRESIRGYLLKLCFKKLSECIQSLRIGDVGNESGIQSGAQEPESTPVVPVTPTKRTANNRFASGTGADNDFGLIQSSRGLQTPSSVAASQPIPPNADDWFDDGDKLLDSICEARRVARLILLLQLFIQRYHYEPTSSIKVQVVAGRDDSVVTVITLLATDSVGLLRKRIGEYFREAPDNITITRMTKATGILGGAANLLTNAEKFEKDLLTIRQAKISNNECIVARRKEADRGTKATAPTGANANTASDIDVIHADDLTVGLLDVLTPISWLSNEDTIDDAVKKPNDGVQAYFLFSIPHPPLPVHPDMTAFMELPAVITSGDTKLTAVPAPSTPHGKGGINQSAAQQLGADSSARLLDVLGPFIRSSPQYLDQLLEMLDGYLSSELQGVVGSDFDLSSAVWDVLQSLPTHPILLKQVRAIGSNTSDNSYVTQLLDPHCPYRLLYTLQIIDALLSGDNDYRLGASPAHVARHVLVWGVRFLEIGGLDHILKLVGVVSSMILASEGNFLSKSGLNEGDPNRHNGSPKRLWGNVYRMDSLILIHALLNRLLHRLLLLDPLYYGWQTSYIALTPVMSHVIGEISAGRVNSFPGIVLSSIQSRPHLIDMLHIIDVASKAYEMNAIAGSSLMHIAENGLLLLFGLLTALDDGMTVFEQLLQRLNTHSETSLFTLLQLFTLQINDLAIRQAVCQRIFDAAANLWLMCMDPSQSLPQLKKLSRVQLFDKIVDCVIGCSNDNHSTISRKLFDENGGQLFSLIASLQAIQTIPESVLPMNKQGVGTTLRIPADGADLTVTSSQDDTVVPIRNSSNLSQMSIARTDSMCGRFIELLVSHKSKETFHSLAPDSTLLGILRVLLVLATSSVQQAKMGEAHTVSGHDLISFLYVNCLFPNCAADKIESRQQEALFGPLCQTKTSRSLTYAVLYTMCRANTASYCKLLQILGKETSPLSISMNNTARSPRRSKSDCNRSRNKKIKPKPWNYNPGAMVKDQGAFVGLSNQGATCYMNSLLQQLFHSSSFSNSLLQIDTKLTADQISDGQVEVEFDNEMVVFQLQVLFGFLRVSQKRYYDTIPFCKVFKDYDGEPIRLGEQKDINEFAGMLFDKLESNPDVKTLLSNTIQGTFVWKTRSIETPYKSDREENFYMITAEVKNKNSIEESLELFVADELFSGDNKLEDPDAKKKVDALRRCTIRKLPQTLIIHLKRFEFDLETMNRKKVNDLLTFPMELNMYAYTEEGIAAREAKLRPRGADLEPAASEPTSNNLMGPESSGEVAEDQCESSPRPETSAELEDGNIPSTANQAVNSSSAQQDNVQTEFRDPSSPYYQYVLNGIVAHMGAIDSGHYYSFIKDPVTNKWNEFNDRSVIPFSSEDIPNECFGGDETVSGANGVNSTRMKQNNAYLLFYERVKTPAVSNTVTKANTSSASISVSASSNTLSPESADDIKSAEEEIPQQELQLDTNIGAIVAVNCPDTLPAAQPAQLSPVTSNPMTTHMTPKVQHAIWTENTEFQTDRYLYDTTHFRFMWQLQHAAAMETLLARASSTSADVGNDDDIQALHQLAILLLRFNVEVLARARAHSCIPMFFEHLEMLVASNTNRRCAEAIIIELGLDNIQFTNSMTVEVNNGSNVGNDENAPTPLTKRSQIEKQFVQKSCHNWLLQMFLNCPHHTTIRIFGRFLMNCVKLLQPLQQHAYLMKMPTLSSSHSNLDLNVQCTPAAICTPPRKSTNSVLSVDIADTANCQQEPSRDTLVDDHESEIRAESLDADAQYGLLLPVGPESEIISDASGYNSSITRFVYKLLVLVVNYQPEDIVNQHGYRVLSSLLLQISSLGYAEKRMLVAIGTIYRLVCSMLALNPSVTRIPTEELQHSIDLISTLVLATRIPRPDSGNPSMTPTSASFSATRSPFISSEAVKILSDDGEEAVLMLGQDDLQAFLNRIFLEDAITIGTNLTCAALQHVCWSRGSRESLKVLEFIAEKVTECVLSVGGANLAYRPYFRAVSELLLGPAVEPALAFDVIVPALVKKAEVLAVRQYPNDAEYIFAVLKLVNRIGLASSKGHTCVMRLRDMWRNIHSKFIANRRSHSKSILGTTAAAAENSSEGRAAKDPVLFNHPGMLW